MTSPLSYQPNVPDFAGDSFADSQLQLQNNFQFLYNAFLKNHIALDALTALGNHTVIQLAQQNNDQQTNVDELALYSKDDPTQTDQIFLRNQGNAAPIPLTTYQLYALPTIPNKQDQFFTFLPGRIIAYFGVIHGSNDQVYLELNPRVATKIFSVSFCGLSSVAGAQIKPNIYIPDAKDKIYRGINVQGNGPAFFYYYLVLANIVSEST